MDQWARELTSDVYAQTRQGSWQGDRELVSQIRCAAVSIMSSIAEGFERGTRSEFVQFLYIAKGSSGEVRTQLQVARDQDCIGESDYVRTLDCVRRVSGMLSTSSRICSRQAVGARSTHDRNARPLPRNRSDDVRAAQEASINGSSRVGSRLLRNALQLSAFR